MQTPHTYFVSFFHFLFPILFVNCLAKAQVLESWQKEENSFMGHFSKVRALMERENICQRHYYYHTTAQRWKVFHSWDVDELVKQEKSPVQSLPWQLHW